LDLTAGRSDDTRPGTISTASLQPKEAVDVMNERKITCLLFVVDPDGSRKVAGILRIRDFVLVLCSNVRRR
jgi:hypothetical protein